MNEIMYSKINDMLDVELAMSRIIALCDITIEYIISSDSDLCNKAAALDKVNFMLMTLRDYATVVEKQANELQ